MTKKRFTIGKIKHFVNDNETNYCYVLELEGDAEHLCILLNELFDENEQLKQRINSRLHFYRELYDSTNDNIVKRVIEDLEDILR